MAIGNQPTVVQLNGQAAQLATMFRTTAQQALYFQAYVVTALGSSGLVALGFTSGDATSMIAMANYMATCAQVFQGTATQGTTFNFQNALIPLTGPS
jgi:hypothetical protein